MGKIDLVWKNMILHFGKQNNLVNKEHFVQLYR